MINITLFDFSRRHNSGPGTGVIQSDLSAGGFVFIHKILGRQR